MMDNQPTPHPTAHEPPRYCRACGYELRGLTTPRCPECGRAFDPSSPRTFRRRPIRRWARHVKRAAIVLVTTIVFLTAAWGWLYRGWHSEQQALAALNVPETATFYRPLLSAWLRQHIGSAGFVLDRVESVSLQTRNDVTDLSSLPALTKLQVLYLGESKVTDWSRLVKLKPLRTMWVPADILTEAQVKELKRAMPGCEISRFYVIPD